MTTAVLLTSEQSLPNLLFLKQFGPFDNYLFLTTAKMEAMGRVDHLLDAAGIQDAAVQRLPIDPENANTAFANLKALPLPPHHSYLVNLTGGTKMMALAAYAFFRNQSGARLVYHPINAAHFLELSPRQAEIPLNVRIGLAEYLKAYGVVLQSRNRDWQSLVPPAKEVMDVVTGRLRGPRAQEIRNWSRSQGLNELPADRRQFYLGEWFEVWLADRLKNMFGLEDGSLWVNAKLNRPNVDRLVSYEYDILFMRRHVLYAVECKYYNRNKVSYLKLKEPLLKYASMTLQFGINAKSFFAIANNIPDGQERAELAERCKLLRLPFPADIQTVVDEDILKSYIKKI